MVAGVVQSIAIFVEAEPVQKVFCFALGCAVIESMRGQGLATDIVMKAMEELQRGLQRNGIRQFYVEAVAATSNIPSNRLAKRFLSGALRGGTEPISGEPIFHYLKLFK